MSQVGHTGSTQNAPVDYSSHGTASAGAGSLDGVGRGDLDGENIRFAREQKNSEVLKGQQNRSPLLDSPDDVKPTHLEAASQDVGDISAANEKALASTSELAKAIREGKLSPEQQAQLQKHADTLRGAASQLSTLHGHNLGGTEGKRSVLAGLGYNQSQLDTLMMLGTTDKLDKTLADLHGGQAALQGKKDTLKSMGFSESQVDALLSLANPDDEGNSLMSTHQTSTGESSSSQRVSGFTQAQSERLLALLDGQKFGTEQQKALLQKMGFDSEAADILLAAADPITSKAQGKLIQSTNTEQVQHLQQLAQAAQTLSTGSPLGDRVVQQLVDIFAVLELLHEMSVQSRRTARETRSIEYDAAKQEILNQASEMRKAAVYSLAAGIASGTMKIGAGAVAIGGASSKGSAANMQMKMQQSTQISQMVSGVGDMVAAGLNYQATGHQAKQKEHEAFQKTHENAAQSSSEWMQLQQDMVKTVQSKMDEIIRTWYETLKTTTRG